jgi:hypothetical protein
MDTDPLLVTNCITVVTSMDGNANYVTPIPTLTIITSGIGDFSAAISDAADGGKTLKAIKNGKRDALVALMRQLASYVTVACLADMTKLLSSGLPVQKPDRSRAAVPGTPSAPVLSQGRTGEMFAVTSSDATVYIYNWRVALASVPTVYVQHGQSTGGRATFAGLTAGELYNVEVNAVGTAGTSDWSDDGTMMVI